MKPTVKRLVPRLAVVAGTALAATALTVPTALAAGPPMPKLQGKALMDVYRSIDYRTRVDVHDASGAKRYVLWPPSWKVCTQSPAPGKQINGQTVSVGVVKKDETCPK